MTAPTAEKLLAHVSLGYGSTAGAEEWLVDYNEDVATTGNQKIIIPLKYIGAAADQSLNLATYLATATFIAVIDRGGTGIKVGMAAAGTKHWVAANGIYLVKNGNTTPPTLYFDNPSATLAATIQVIVLGSST